MEKNEDTSESSKDSLEFFSTSNAASNALTALQGYGSTTWSPRCNINNHKAESSLTASNTTSPFSNLKLNSIEEEDVFLYGDSNSVPEEQIRVENYSVISNTDRLDTAWSDEDDPFVKTPATNVNNLNSKLTKHLPDYNSQNKIQDIVKLPKVIKEENLIEDIVPPLDISNKTCVSHKLESYGSVLSPVIEKNEFPEVSSSEVRYKLQNTGRVDTAWSDEEDPFVKTSGITIIKEENLTEDVAPSLEISEKASVSHKVESHGSFLSSVLEKNEFPEVSSSEVRYKLQNTGRVDTAWSDEEDPFVKTSGITIIKEENLTEDVAPSLEISEKTSVSHKVESRGSFLSPVIEKIEFPEVNSAVVDQSQYPIDNESPLKQIDEESNVINTSKHVSDLDEYLSADLKTSKSPFKRQNPKTINKKHLENIRVYITSGQQKRCHPSEESPVEKHAKHETPRSALPSRHHSGDRFSLPGHKSSDPTKYEFRSPSLESGSHPAEEFSAKKHETSRSFSPSRRHSPQRSSLPHHKPILSKREEYSNSTYRSSHFVSVKHPSRYTESHRRVSPSPKKWSPSHVYRHHKRSCGKKKGYNRHSLSPSRHHSPNRHSLSPSRHHSPNRHSLSPSRHHSPNGSSLPSHKTKSSKRGHESSYSTHWSPSFGSKEWPSRYTERYTRDSSSLKKGSHSPDYRHSRRSSEKSTDYKRYKDRTSSFRPRSGSPRSFRSRPISPRSFRSRPIISRLVRSRSRIPRSFRSRSRSAGSFRSRSRSAGSFRSRSRSAGSFRSRSRSAGSFRSRSRSTGSFWSRSRSAGSFSSRSRSRSPGSFRSMSRSAGSFSSRSRSRSPGSFRSMSRSSRSPRSRSISNRSCSSRFKSPGYYPISTKTYNKKKMSKSPKKSGYYSKKKEKSPFSSSSSFSLDSSSSSCYSLDESSDEKSFKKNPVEPDSKNDSLLEDEIIQLHGCYTYSKKSNSTIQKDSISKSSSDIYNVKTNDENKQDSVNNHPKLDTVLPSSSREPLLMDFPEQQPIIAPDSSTSTSAVIDIDVVSDMQIPVISSSQSYDYSTVPSTQVTDFPQMSPAATFSGPIMPTHPPAEYNPYLQMPPVASNGSQYITNMVSKKKKVRPSTLRTVPLSENLNSPPASSSNTTVVLKDFPLQKSATKSNTQESLQTAEQSSEKNPPTTLKEKKAEENVSSSSDLITKSASEQKKRYIEQKRLAAVAKFKKIKAERTRDFYKAESGSYLDKMKRMKSSNQGGKEDLVKDKNEDANEQKKTIKGAEFVKPVTGFCCVLCKKMFLDKRSIEQHLEGHQHFANYDSFIKKHPTYEQDHENVDLINEELNKELRSVQITVQHNGLDSNKEETVNLNAETAQEKENEIKMDSTCKAKEPKLPESSKDVHSDNSSEIENSSEIQKDLSGKHAKYGCSSHCTNCRNGAEKKIVHKYIFIGKCPGYKKKSAEKNKPRGTRESISNKSEDNSEDSTDKEGHEK